MSRTQTATSFVLPLLSSSLSLTDTESSTLSISSASSSSPRLEQQPTSRLMKVLSSSRISSPASLPLMPPRDIEEADAYFFPSAASSSKGNNTSVNSDGDPYTRRSSAAVHSNSNHYYPDNNNEEHLTDGSSGRTSSARGDCTVILVETSSSSSAAAAASATVATTRRTGPSTGPLKKLPSPPEPKLLHPILLKIPLHLRFGITGLLTNVLFMVVYSSAIALFEHKASVSTIYAITYLIFIPLGHLLVSVFVFGWPDHYLASLASNFPIGLTAIAIGSVLTGYLDSIDFSNSVDDYLRDYFTFSRMPPRVTADRLNQETKNEFWSSILVLIVTSVWTYVLSIYINSPEKKSVKKEQ